MKTFRKHHIQKGDRIYVRAMQDGVKVLEMTVDNVADMTDLIGEIRYAGHSLEGLVRLFIRNHSQGWSIERPMRFYTGVPSPKRRALQEALREAAAALNIATPAGVASMRDHRGTMPAANGTLNLQPARMPFPWETH